MKFVLLSCSLAVLSMAMAFPAEGENNNQEVEDNKNASTVQEQGDVKVADGAPGILNDGQSLGNPQLNTTLENIPANLTQENPLAGAQGIFQTDKSPEKNEPGLVSGISEAKQSLGKRQVNEEDKVENNSELNQTSGNPELAGEPQGVFKLGKNLETQLNTENQENLQSGEVHSLQSGENKANYRSVGEDQENINSTNGDHGKLILSEAQNSQAFDTKDNFKSSSEDQNLNNEGANKSETTDPISNSSVEIPQSLKNPITKRNILPESNMQFSSVKDTTPDKNQFTSNEELVQSNNSTSRVPSDGLKFRFPTSIFGMQTGDNTDRSSMLKMNSDGMTKQMLSDTQGEKEVQSNNPQPQ